MSLAALMSLAAQALPESRSLLCTVQSSTSLPTILKFELTRRMNCLFTVHYRKWGRKMENQKNRGLFNSVTHASPLVAASHL